MKTPNPAKFLLILLAFLVLPSFVQASPRGDAIREARNAITLIHVVCAYDITFKSNNAKPMQVVTHWFGNGFFTEQHPGRTHLLKTAAHVVACPKVLSD